MTIDKTYQAILTGVIFLAIGCQPTFRSDFDFECADQLADGDINALTLNGFQDYSDTDLDLLADITTFIIHSNGATSAFEVFYNEKTENSLTVDVYGLDNEQQIDKTVCGLFNNKDILLPRQMTLLFHRYVNGYEDGGIVVGLTNKKE